MPQFVTPSVNSCIILPDGTRKQFKGGLLDIPETDKETLKYLRESNFGGLITELKPKINVPNVKD